MPHEVDLCHAYYIYAILRGITTFYMEKKESKSISPQTVEAICKDSALIFFIYLYILFAQE